MFGTRTNETNAAETKKDSLQRDFDGCEHIFNEAAEESNRLAGQVRAEQKAIDELTAQYDTACRQFASGDAAEIAPIVAELERRKDRLRRLELLHKEAADRVPELHAAQEAAARALLDETERLEIERLDAVISAAKAERDKQLAALNSAEQAVRNAVWALSNLRRKRELRDKERLLQQRRA
jgi:hypothetical protein